MYYINMILNKFRNNIAFSLIEFSIVIIIISLIIAELIGATSLVKTAKYRAISAEMFDWPKVAFIFQHMKGRLPGDLNQDEFIDGDSNFPENIKFPYPYDGTNSEYQKPNYFTAPFVELYLANLINFKPLKTSISTNLKTLADNKALPKVKHIGNAFYFFKYSNESSTTKNNWLYHAINSNAISIHDDGYFTIDPHIHKYIDTKYDDGIYNDGRIRGACKNNKGENSTYDKAIEDKQKCGELMYLMKTYNNS